jgi:hypothetical protein
MYRFGLPVEQLRQQRMVLCRPIQQPDAYPDAYPDANAYSNPDTYPNAYPDSNTYADPKRFMQERRYDFGHDR